MSAFQLICENPSIAQLAERFPLLRRFVGNSHTDIRFHRDNAVGLYNNGRILRVSLVNGDIERVV